MNSTNIYIYKQTQVAILIQPGIPSSASNLRYKAVYAKNLILHKGVDNILQIWFKNTDQKKVDITGLAFTFRLISKNTEELLLETRLTNININKGYTEVFVTEQQLASIPAQHAYYSIELDNGTLSLPAFVDEQGGGRGVCDVVDSVYPKHIVSKNIKPLQVMQQPTLEYIQLTEEYQTSVQSLHTFQIDIIDYDGIMQFQGAVDDANVWYDINAAIPLSGTGSGMYNIAGFHPKIRIKFTSAVNTGIVEKVIVR